MHKLSFTLILFLIAFYVQAQSPHGESFKIDCVQCHTSNSWSVDVSKMQFNHNNTNFKLIGQHKNVSCKGCHKSLDFKDKRQSCTECHTDMHNNTLGKDCARCHTPNSWIIKNTSEMHQQSRFPLLGAHRTALCTSCHKSSSNFQFEPIGIACIDCHQKDFQSTTSPNHILDGYSTNCIECHNVSSSSWNTKVVDHSFFPLTAGHAISCTQCHVTGSYGKLPTNCNSCHQKNYSAAQIPNHTAAGITSNCETCHTNTSWKPSSFNHITTGYELKGAHTALVQCSDCHKGNLTSAKTECINCHQVQYDNAVNHKKAGYSTDCITCHTPTNWLQSSFNHATTNYPLTGAHKTVECALCHTSQLKGTPTICNSCHQKDYTASLVPSHSAAGMPNTCETCHTTTVWKPSTFNHTTTGFELTGGHKNMAQCSDCHIGTLTAAKPECISCHQVQYNNAPNHKQLGYSTNCVTCHGTGSATWSSATIDHSFFPLTAGHNIGCIQCHVSGTNGKLPTDCNSCHQKNYIAAQVPNHTVAGIPTTCENCHTPTTWKPSSFNHTTTGFELKGTHNTLVQCSDCHKGNLTSAKTECISCHQVQYDTAPNHKQSGYPTDCAMCHTPINWLQSSFNHSTTSFPLTGAHTSVNCALCHTNGFAGGTPTVCNSCHQKDYTASQVPSHSAAGIPNTCETCHTSTAWKPSSFNHTATGFELKGAHNTLIQCSDCHKGNLTSAKTECISCHQGQYDTAPNHKQASYSTDCVICHGPGSVNWTSATIDHSFFPLTAGHNIGCIQCHVSGTNGKLPTDCNSCHQKNYVAAQVPNHTVAGIPTTCETCHTPTTWKPSSFNHTTTGFELKGTHNTLVQCSDCHKGNLTSAKTECISCHQVQYNNAPNHKNAGYSTDCTTCHTPINWLQSSFNHSTTNYPLTGVHKTVECALCHTSQLKGTPTICSSCHQKDYIAALVPSHSAAGIPNTCETCHTTTAWKPSSFNHTTTGFELKGAHNTLIQCSDCHKGNLTSAKTECISCHQVQYDTAPNHKQSGYPTDCAMCHTPINWLQSSFNHATTIFPLTGAHTSVNCVLCHTNGFAGGTPTVCNSCHQKDYTAALVPSHSAAGIPNTCETCHTTTAWKPSSFSHITTGYELKGAHSTLTQCSDCHKGNLTAAKPECISCHQVQYDGAAGHKQLGYPTDCTICHTTVNWLQSSFNHSTTSFPLTGAHTTVACSLCHTSGFPGTPTACFSCHATTYNNTTNPNHKGANFPTTCQTCHSTTNWTSSTFNHTSYFPINTSRHNVNCATCHTNSANYTVYTCITTACHAKAHNRSQGSTGCYNCHPTGRAD